MRKDPGKLTGEQREQLNELGFDFRPRRGRDLRVSGGRNYQARLAELKEFVAEHGHARVSTRDPRFRTLAHWLSNLRSGIHRLDAPERQELKSLGVRLERQTTKPLSES